MDAKEEGSKTLEKVNYFVHTKSWNYSYRLEERLEIIIAVGMFQ